MVQARVTFFPLLWVLFLLTTLSCIHAEHHVHDAGGIPPLIFRTFEAENWQDLHAAFHQVLNDTHALSPGYLQVYFSSRDRDRFIARYFPRYLPLYRKLLPGAYRADLWRLLVLFRYGGVYADMGMRLLVPMEKVISRKSPSDDFVGATSLDETSILNGFLATKPRLPLLSYMLRWVMDNVEKERHGCNNLDITGPKALGRAMHRFLSLSPSLVFSAGNMTFSVPNLSHPIRVRLHRFAQPHMIKDSTGTMLIKNKFENYHSIVYNNEQANIHYGALYYFRRVYASSLPPSLANSLGDFISPSASLSDDSRVPSLSTLNSTERSLMHTVADSLSVYEGSLLQRGREFFLVINGTRWGFPDYDTFLSLGLTVCTGCVVKHERAFALPEGPIFSKDPQKLEEEFNQCLPQIKMLDDVEMSFPMKAEDMKKRVRRLLHENKREIAINAEEFFRTMEGVH